MLTKLIDALKDAGMIDQIHGHFINLKDNRTVILEEDDKTIYVFRGPRQQFKGVSINQLLCFLRGNYSLER